MKKSISLSFLALTALIYAQVPVATKLSAELLQKYYQVESISAKSGILLDKVTINGPSRPPLPVLGTTVSNSASSNDVESVTTNTVASLEAPAFKWSFGCAATAGAMVAGYYDRHGYPYVYAGPTNEGKIPLDSSSWPTWTDSSGAVLDQTPLSATHQGLDGRTVRGHVDDYWVKYDSSDDDPFITNGWTEHTYGECTGDYMKTNQTTNYGNSDGATTFYFYNSGDPLTAEQMEDYNISKQDGGYGLKLFFESRGYKVTTLFNQKIDTVEQDGFTFEQYKAEIDAGHPVLIHVTGHTMTGIGYNDTNNTVYLHDTWDFDTHSMTWGGSYSGMDHEAVTVIHLAPNIVQNDFNKDGIPDILFRNETTGENLIYFFNQTGTRASYAYTSSLSGSWSAEGLGDFNGDGISDILFRESDSGKNMIFFQNPDGSRASYAYTSSLSSAWHVAGIADFNGDKIADILFRDQNSGKNLIFFQNADGSRASYKYTASMSSDWYVADVGDFNNDGIADILYRELSTHKVMISLQNSDGSRASYKYTAKMGSSWKVDGLGDFNNDGVLDIFYRNYDTGKNLISFQNSDGSRASYAYTDRMSTDWHAAVADVNGDKIADILYRNTSNGKNMISFQNADGSRASYKYTTSLSPVWKAVF